MWDCRPAASPVCIHPVQGRLWGRIKRRFTRWLPVATECEATAEAAIRAPDAPPPPQQQQQEQQQQQQQQGSAPEDVDPAAALAECTPPGVGLSEPPSELSPISSSGLSPPAKRADHKKTPTLPGECANSVLSCAVFPGGWIMAAPTP